MELYVKFLKDSREIEVLSIKEVDRNCSNKYFFLAKTFDIEEIRYSDKNLNWTKEEYIDDLLAPMYKYNIVLPNDSTSSLYIKYKGTLSGSHRYYNNYLIHFSLYNVWYPIFEDEKDDYYVSLDISDNWELIKGKYDEDYLNWNISYINEDLNDCNILLVNKKKYCIEENEFAKVYYLNYQKDYGRFLLDNYSKVNSYYEELYGRKNPNKENIAILPFNEEWPNSDYKRDSLTVLTPDIENIDMDRLSNRSLKDFAHEMGHAYGRGADTSSWEDWLNETIAEWSALLCVKNVEKRDILPYIEEHKMSLQGDSLILNPKGVERPKDVHDIGTLIFYSIYLKYGEEVIKKLLVFYDRLEIKSTSNYLIYLDKEGFKFISDEIRKYII